jgi:hypothetical protein
MRRRDGTIVAAALAVAAIVATATYAFVIAPARSSSGPCTALECGLDWSAGNAVGPTICTASGTPSLGCVSNGDYVYELTIETSTLHFNQVLFAVDTGNRTPIVVVPDGAFAIVDTAGNVVAECWVSAGWVMQMNSTNGWTYFGDDSAVGPNTFLGNDYSIVVDVGLVDPAGAGYEFVTAATNGPSGVSVSELP